MSEIVSPYGDKLVDLRVSPEEGEELRVQARDMAAVNLSDRSICDLEMLAVDARRRSRLAEYGRTTVVERFSLRRGADIMEAIYADVVRSPGRRPSLGEAARMAARALRLEIHQHRSSVKRRRAWDERGRLEAAAASSQRSD